MTDFNKTMYKLDAEHMIVLEDTLWNIVLDNALETTSPRGVEPVYHVVEGDDCFELRVWKHNGHAEHVGYYDTVDDAFQARMEAIYDEITNHCCTYRWSELNRWFDSVDEAVQDYVDAEDDEEVTVESVMRDIDAKRAEIEESKAVSARNLEVEVKGVYDFWKSTGNLTWRARKLANKVRYDGYRFDGIWYMHIRYSDIATEETMRMINEMISSK